MPDLTTPLPEEVPPAQKGYVTTAPVDIESPFTVTVPGFSTEHFYEIHRWMPRGEELPKIGDEVLVVLDDKGEPWVPAWWPM